MKGHTLTKVTFGRNVANCAICGNETPIYVARNQDGYVENVVCAIGRRAYQKSRRANKEVKK